MGEITPVSAENSRTLSDDEVKHAAKLAIDGDLSTAAYTLADDEGKKWLKLTLDHANCVEKVIWFYANGVPLKTWKCTENDCSECNGGICNDYILTVSIEGAGPDLSSVLNCRYGDTVKFERKDGSSLHIIEIAVFGKKGKIYSNRCNQSLRFASEPITSSFDRL